MNLALIGYRGTGKTIVAQYLAQKLHFNCISLDAEIEKQIAMPIAEFVQKKGWPAFRKIETDILFKTKTLSNHIIDCGGGIIEQKENQTFLKKNCRVIWLKATPETIRNRIQDSQNRPALSVNQTFLSEIETVLSRRNPWYSQTAQFSIQTDTLSSKEVAHEILKKLFHIKIAVGITADTKESFKNAIQKAQTRAELLELRIDFLPNLSLSDLSEIIKYCRVPIIVTNRIASEGGLFKGSEPERIALLKKAIELCADYIDIENCVDPQIIHELNQLKRNSGSKIICSYHNFKEVPRNLKAVYESIKNTGSDIIKIACMGQSVFDNLKILNVIQKAHQDQVPIIALLMGKYGKISRVMSGLFGAHIYTFAPIGDQTWVNGQLTYDEVIETASTFLNLT